MRFWKSPGKYILNSGPNANAVAPRSSDSKKSDDLLVMDPMVIVLMTVVATFCVTIGTQIVVSGKCRSKLFKNQDRKKYNEVASSNIEFSSPTP